MSMHNSELVQNIETECIKKTVKDIYTWLKQRQERTTVLCGLSQPMTASQIHQRTKIPTSLSSHILRQLCYRGLVRCLNPRASNNHLYWHTVLGQTFQKALQQEHEKKPTPTAIPNSINWEQYARLCFRHRAAVIKALSKPLQPADIKRRASAQNPNLRMSANNVRDVIRVLQKEGIVRPVKVKGKTHLHYEHTERGKQFQHLLTLIEYQ